MSCFSVFLSAGRFSCVGLPVDPKAHIAQRLHLRKQFGELALLAACHRGQHHQARSLGQGQHGVHHLAHGLRLQRQAVVGAVGVPARANSRRR